MNYITVAAIAVFAVTLFLMIKRPRGLRIGYAAAIGAVASLLLGTVSLGQAAQSFFDIWDAALAFLGIIALSVTLDAMGFFRWAALRVVKLAQGSGLRLYFYIALLTAAVSILFANDSAVLILTPIVLEIVTCLGIDKRGKLAYLFHCRTNRRHRRHAPDNKQPHQYPKRRLFQVQLHRPPHIHGARSRCSSSEQFAVDLAVLPKTDPQHLRRTSCRVLNQGQTRNLAQPFENNLGNSCDN